MIRAMLAGLMLVCSLSPVATAGVPARPKPAATPAGSRVIDLQGHLEGARVGIFTTNLGAFAFDMQSFSPLGLEFPRQSGKGVVFASGIWLGAMVGGAPRVTVSEYSSEFAPGIASGAIPEIPHQPELRVFKLLRTYPDAPTRDAALQDYQFNAYPRGAPYVEVMGDGTLSIPGDQMTYAVYNDLDPSIHNSAPGATNPLQVEVRHTSWVYDRPGPVGNTVFMRFTIINRGPILLDETYLTLWVDPDLGDFVDDLAGCDIGRSLVYCYNGYNNDLVYGETPPAVGYDLLQGPYSAAAGARLPMTAHVSYTNGTDPTHAGESYRMMRGLTRAGAPIVDPSQQTTTFMYSGDPVAGTGWNNTVATDQRLMLSSGPFDMSSGHLQEVVLAIIVAQGADRLSSVSLLKQYDDVIQAAFDANQLDLLDAPAPSRPARLEFTGVRPNPSSGAAVASFSLPRECDVTLDVLDLAGRRVASEAWPALAPGVQRRPVPAAARALPPGVYLLRISAGGESATRRWVVLD